MSPRDSLPIAASRSAVSRLLGEDHCGSYRSKGSAWRASTAEACPERDGLPLGELAELAVALAGLYREHSRLLHQVGAAFGLNLTDIRTVQHLGAAAAPVTAGEVAAVVGLGSGATTTVLDRLEQRELVLRLANPADRRSVHVLLTAAGQEVTRALQEAYTRGFTRPEIGLTYEQFLPLIANLTASFTAATANER